MSQDDALATAIALAETEAAAKIAAAISAAQIAAGATEQSAVTMAQADVTVAKTRAQADVQVASITSDATVAVAETNLTGTEYSSDKQLTGVEFSQNAETQRLQATLAFAQDKWNQVWPYLQGLLGNPDQGGGSASWNALVAALGDAPFITQGGVWTPSQVQAQLNALYARSDRRSATLIHDAQIDLAGRGFGSASPLMDMLQFSYEAEAMQARVEGAQQLALQSAQSNAEQLLAQQSKRQDQHAAQEQYFSEISRIAVELSTQTLAAVAQIVSASVR